MPAKLKKRKDGRYAKQITIGVCANGKPIKKTVYGLTIKETEAKARSLINQLEHGIPLESHDITVDDLTTTWYRLKKEKNLKVNSQRNYDFLKNLISKHIGTIKVVDVTQYTIESMLNAIIDSGRRASAKTILSVMRDIFRYAVKAKIITTNPCDDIQIKYFPAEKRPLSDLEIAKIDRAQLSAKERVLISVFRYTGMRRGEVFALEKGDIDFDRRCIYVSKTLVDNSGHPYISQTPKTNAGNRTVPIMDNLYDILKEYIRTLDTDLLFLTKNETLYGSPSLDFKLKSWRKKIGLGPDVTYHTFRHTFISDCYRAGVPVKKLQHWVGHSNPLTTLQIYTHLSQDDIEDFAIMNDYYSNRRNKSKTSQNHIREA